jgi:hypothetical protein
MAPDHLPEPGQIAGQGVSGAMGQFVGPHPFDQLVGRYEAVDVDQHRHQNTALTGRTDVEWLPVGTGLDVAE